MLRYRTEIIVPPDRYVFLQLPDHLPEGRATVTVSYHDPEPSDAEEPGIDEVGDLDRQDIEWWEEFEERRGTTP